MKQISAKEHLKNIGTAALAALWAVVGGYFTKGLKLDHAGSTTFFGGNSLVMMLAWFIPGLVVIVYVFQENSASNSRLV